MSFSFVPTTAVNLPSWHSWVSLGGSVGSFPDCHPTNASDINCWARSLGAQLIENAGPPAGPRAWTNIAGSVAGPPICIVRSARTDCFVSTSLNRLAWITATGATWGSWIDLGANTTGQPYCLAIGASGIDCYAGGTDKAVWRWSYNGTSWKSPVKLGGSTVTRVTCVARSGTDCFYIDASSALWTIHVSTTGTATAAKKLATGFGLAPTCISNGSKLDCFAQSKSHTLLKGFFNGKTWQAWSDLGGNVASDATCTRTSTAANPDFDCFYTNASDHLVERQRTDNVWQPEADRGGSIQQKPACVVGSDRKDCFAWGRDNTLRQTSFY